MRSNLITIRLLVLLAWLATGGALKAQQTAPSPVAGQVVADDEVVRVNTALVTVPVRVLDRQGRFIPDLQADQFKLYEDGNEQEIAYFERAEQPFTVALLLDASDSTTFKLKDIRAAALAFVNQLRPADRVILMAFDQQRAVLAEATSDRRVLTAAIQQTQTGGGTSLYSTLDFIFRQRLNQLRGRKAIVLFTDGVDTSSREATYQTTLHAVEEQDALIYAIQYDTYNDVLHNSAVGAFAQEQMIGTQTVTATGELLSVAYERANRYLRLLAGKTGGRFFNADTLPHLTEAFAQIAQELRQQYSLGYYPQNRVENGTRRKLKVRVRASGAAVRARSSYVYLPQPGATKP